jgi:hypothetical protein
MWGGGTSRTMLMFCILGLVAELQSASASPAGSDWKASARATMVINKANFGNQAHLRGQLKSCTRFVKRRRLGLGMEVVLPKGPREF